jgi:histidinol phosphatase-like PHP family hydrolase
MRDHDLHIHTVFSRDVKDGTLSMENIVRRAGEKEIKTVGFADHYHPGFIVPRPEEIAQARGFVRRQRGAARVYLGAEASILNRRGDLTLSGGERELFDYVIASLHPHFPGMERTPSGGAGELVDFIHRIYMGAAVNPLADIIGHPWNLHSKSIYDNTFSFYGLCRAAGLSPAACFGRIPDSYFEEFADAVRGSGKAVELNAYAVATRETGCLYGEDEDERNSFGDCYLRFFHILAGRNVKFTAGSDAHSLSHVGDTLLLGRYFEMLGVGGDRLWSPEDARR